MRCCSRLCMFTSVVVFAIFISFWYAPSMFETTVPPQPKYSFNISYAKQILGSLCGLYREGRISGDLCNRLCYFGNYSFIDFYAANKIVFVLLFGGQKLVLKSQQPYFGAFDQLGDISQKEFEAKLVEMTNYHLQLGWEPEYKNHLLQVLWPPSKRSRKLSQADRRSLWTLISQEEYLTFSVMNMARVFPKVMGSCGHFYAVEYLVPFRLKSYYTNLKAKILVHLMGTLKLFYEFLNEPLHWCDVKFENFGLSAEYPKRFLIMDGDMVFTETRMQQLLTGLGCRSDEDCRFFDCQAKCNLETNHCTNRLNDNVDIFCEKLVGQLFGNFWTKSNRYLAACHAADLNQTQRLQELRLVWAWSLSDV